MPEGVQWLIDFDSKTKGATDALFVMDKIEVKGEAATKAITEMGTALDKSSKKAGDTGKALTDMADKGKTHTEGMWKEMLKGELVFEAIRRGAELAWNGIKTMTSELISEAAGAERIGRVFDNMLGVGEGKATLEYLEKFATMSEFTGHTLRGMGAELLRAGLRGADFRNALGAAVDVAAQAPDKMEGLQEAISSLSRISLMGKVDARTLRGLRLNPHEVAEQMSQDLGMTKEAIKKQLQEGTLDGTKAMQSIFTVMERKSGKQLGGLGEAMADTFGAKWEKIKKIPEEMFESMADTPAWGRMSSALDDILAAFGPDSEAGAALREGLADVVEWAADTVKTTDWKEVATDIKDIVKGSKDWFKVLGDIASVAEKIITVYRGAGKMLDAVGGGIRWGYEHLGGLGKSSVGEFGSTANEFRKAQAEAAMEKAGLAQGAALGRGTESGAKDALDIHSPSKVFEEIGRQSAAGFALGWSAPPPVAQTAATPDFDTSAMGKMGGGRSVSIAPGAIMVSPQIHVSGTNASADDIAREIAVQVPAALLSALEQLNIEGGLA
jgi:tape measure domain-containing protein